METSSWLGKAVSRYSRSLSPEEARSTSKTPRWRTPSPIAASMIPPPIVSSTYLTSTPAHSPGGAAPASSTDHDLLFFRRKQKQLEAHLQILLDAQAEGLLSGLASNTPDDASLSAASTPPANLNARMRSSKNAVSSPQGSGKIGLHDARKAIHTTMRRLALLKAQESDQLTPELEECNALVHQLDVWLRKRERLEERTRQIQQGEEHARARELRQKADDMQNDINDLEARLAQMKAQQTKLRKEAQDCENEVHADLSSYTASLAILEQHSKDFLSDLPPSTLDVISTLPHQPRVKKLTLDTAREAFSRQRDRLQSQQATIERDREALEDGAVVWKDVVKDVMDFERKLRNDTARLSAEKARPSMDTESDALHDNNTIQSPTNDMQDLLAHLDQTTVQLESKYKLAQTRDWKLLVAAIGAELEAFLKGRDILDAALAASTEQLDQQSFSDAPNQGGGGEFASQSVYEDLRTPRGSVMHHARDSEAIRDLDEAFEPKRSNGTIVSSDTDNESDGPDPELLISHQQDTDFE
ncbi:hypothetical protein AAFC00_006383 [Neodothiora populina]|uniref:Autophagy-related protein Atg28 n=1 Tax=Neodothiora populina TaxID=2781224 RepID=A0ABR3P503_9PEZI